MAGLHVGSAGCQHEQQRWILTDLSDEMLHVEGLARASGNENQVRDKENRTWKVPCCRDILT